MTFHCRNCDDGVMLHRREHRYSSVAVYSGWTLLGLGGVAALLVLMELATGAGTSTTRIVWASVALCSALIGQILAHKREVFRCDECGALRVATPGVQVGKRRRGTVRAA